MVPNFAQMTISELANPQGFSCSCGRHHSVPVQRVLIGQGVLRALPEVLSQLRIEHPFFVCDVNTKKAAWDPIRAIVEEAGIAYQLYCFPQQHVEPDEYSVGSLCMAFDRKCDGIVAIGSGVINDCCKVLAHCTGVPQAVIATAPSMDGYASNSSSMIRDRVKVTLYNASPKAIIADTLILKEAPMRMLWAGLGDMLAKYIALCEWRISHLVTGEYYCENVACLMRASLDRIIKAAPHLPERDPAVIEAVMEGLILSGFAMSFAQVSRPASGLEHYFSHLWEMLALSREEKADLHGIQVGIGTCLTLRILDKLRMMTPDTEKMHQEMRTFSSNVWETEMREVFGETAEQLIRAERDHWHKNDLALREKRFEKISGHWDEILQIMQEELPEAERIISLMKQTGMPTEPGEIGITMQDTRKALIHSRDIRDKYLTSSLLWDMGLLANFSMTL